MVADTGIIVGLIGSSAKKKATNRKVSCFLVCLEDSIIE